MAKDIELELGLVHQIVSHDEHDCDEEQRERQEREEAEWQHTYVEPHLPALLTKQEHHKHQAHQDHWDYRDHYDREYSADEHYPSD
jgi:hypothetical protein